MTHELLSLGITFALPKRPQFLACLVKVPFSGEDLGLLEMCLGESRIELKDTLKVVQRRRRPSQ